MKKIFAFIVALAMVAAFGGATFAEEKKAAEEVMVHSGEIAAVDVKSNTFTMKTKGGDINCEVTADTKITAGKDTKTLADIKVGDKAECKCVKKDGKLVSKSLEIKTEKKEEKK